MSSNRSRLQLTRLEDVDPLRYGEGKEQDNLFRIILYDQLADSEFI